MERASNLRMIALTSVIALAVVLPLAAATAGPAGPAGPPARTAPSDKRSDQRSDEAHSVPRVTATGSPRSVTACGPQLASPEGVQAQTCTIVAAGDTWARTYYRNATGGPLGGVLILMRPDGRTVRVECPIGPENGPGSCETPRERTVKAASPEGTAPVYSAVAEFASAGSDRMLLRAGSNR